MPAAAADTGAAGGASALPAITAVPVEETARTAGPAGLTILSGPAGTAVAEPDRRPTRAAVEARPAVT